MAGNLNRCCATAMSERPTRAIVDLRAIGDNVAVVRQLVGPDCTIAAVVKADGYCHGSVQVARAAIEAGAAFLCVALPQEGVKLREHFREVPILVLGTISPPEAETVVNFDLAQTVDDEAILPYLSKAAALYGKTVRLHLKLDTGMSRIGVRPDEAVGFMERAAREANIEIEGIYSHFASSDHVDLSYARRQLAVFRDVLAELEGKGFAFRLRHIANSAAVLSLPESHLDMVRPGIMIYGLRPASHLGEGLRPAMAVVSRITKLKTLPDGTPVSYGCTYRCEGPRRIATIPMGYADGYRRALSNRFHVLIGGKKAPVVGRVCMDMFMVDVSELDGVRTGDEVLIFGKSEDGYLPAEEMAKAIDSIPYEIVTGITSRVPRIHRG